MLSLTFDEPTILAGLIIVLFGVATALMVLGELMIAGGIFLTATFVIYLRETRY